MLVTEARQMLVTDLPDKEAARLTVMERVRVSRRVLRHRCAPLLLGIGDADSELPSRLAVGLPTHV
jgi:hypothetical protein